MEACGSAHHWGRLASRLGHRALLTSPQFVSPYVKSNKNDANDADGIAEAACRPTMRFVGVKDVDRQCVRQTHRARQLAVKARTAQCNQIHGFLLEYGIDELRAEAHRNHDSAPPDSGFRATMLLRRGRIWEEAAIHPWVLALAEYLLGRGCLIYQSDTIVKGPGLDTHPGLHADYGASRVAEPFPEYCLEATAIWAIDDFDLPAGPTVIVPGSFRNRRQVPAGTTRERAIPLELAKGSIAFWHGATWHGAMPRQTAGRRTSLHNAYVRFFMRPLERYDDIDRSVVDRNPPAFATLCGLDDPFGKSGDTGADFERMRYAASAGYGSTAPVA